MARSLDDLNAEADRREFLGRAGRFAVVVPPVMTVLLSTTMSSAAIAASGGKASGVQPGGVGGVGGGLGQASPFPGHGVGASGAAPSTIGPGGGVGGVAAGPAGGSLVAASPDFAPLPYISAPSKKVAASGERG